MSWQVRVRAQAGDVALDVELAGEHGPLALIGPNGGGKSSLRRIIAGARDAEEGEIRVGEDLLFASSSGLNLPSERRRVGYVPQGYGLFPHLRVIDNVAFGLSTGPLRQSRGERRKAARALLEELECEHLAERTPDALSGGEAQRVALARALVIEPKLLLLDEPLAALDATAKRAVRRFLAARLKTMACPSIVVTHDARDVAALEAQVCVLDAGRVVQRGSLDALRAEPANDFVAEFVAALPAA